MTGPYRIRLMFEWGGGCLWPGNDTTRELLDVGPCEDQLPLSEAVRKQMDYLSAWHDQSLNWEYPPDPGPWSAEDYARFDNAANELLGLLRGELGEGFEVVYEPL